MQSCWVQQSAIFSWRLYSSHNLEESSVLLGLIILQGMIRNCLFKSHWTESIYIKTDWQCFQNMGVLCAAVYCHNMSGYECLSMVASWKRKKSNDAKPHVKFRCVPLIFDTFVRWLTSQFLQLCLFMVPFKWNVAWLEKHRAKENPIIFSFLQHFHTKYFSRVTVGWFDVLLQLQFINVWK